MGRCTRYSGAFAIATTVAALLAAPSIHAREQPTEDQLDEAKIHFKAGKLYYDKEKFAKAITEFEAGYELVKKPAFLLNIAQCQRKLGNLMKAREHYARYIEEDPQSPQMGQVEKIIRELDAEIAAAEPEAPPLPPAVEEPVEQEEDSTPGSVPAAALPQSDDDQEVGTRRRRKGKAKSKDEDEEAPFYSRAWFWTLIGFGLIGGGAAGFYITTMRKDFVTEGTIGEIDATTK